MQGVLHVPGHLRAGFRPAGNSIATVSRATVSRATVSRAAVFDGDAHRITLRKIPIPAPRSAEILVRVLGCTLCGSDVHSFEGRRSVPVPTVLGHEIVGEIVEFGDAAECTDLAGHTLAPGDRVTWAIVASCGTCPMCSRGLPQKCLQAVKYGHEPFQPGRELLGGLAEYCLLVPGTAILRLPEGLPLSVACPASCATATVAAALEAAGPLPGQSVRLFGAGMLGLTACAMACAAGAVEIVCVDPVPSRRERAKQFGATRITDPATFPAITDDAVGTLGFDTVVELSGRPAAYRAAWPRIRTGGRLILVGSVFPGDPLPLELEQVVRQQLTISGIHNYAPRHLLAAVNFLATNAGHFPFAALVSAQLPLDSVAEAFAQSRAADAIQIGVIPSMTLQKSS